jgi:uncharacterized membrane protein YbaN (DUF454 family)
VIISLIVTVALLLIALALVQRSQLRDAWHWLRAKRFRREVEKWHREASKISSRRP